MLASSAGANAVAHAMCQHRSRRNMMCQRQQSPTAHQHTLTACEGCPQRQARAALNDRQEPAPAPAGFGEPALLASAALASVAFVALVGDRSLGLCFALTAD